MWSAYTSDGTTLVGFFGVFKNKFQSFPSLIQIDFPACSLEVLLFFSRKPLKAPALIMKRWPINRLKGENEKDGDSFDESCARVTKN